MKPLITSVFLNVTDACNMKCRYCFVKQHPRYMTYETAKAATDFLIKNAEQSGDIPSINFFGGEPLLCWNTIIVPLTEYIREEYKKPFSLSMTSNGALMTEEKLQFMKDNNIGLLFSIDGDKETQDYNRPLSSGKSSFDKVEWLIEKIPKLYPNGTFRSTIIPATCGNTFHNIQFAKNHGWKNIFVIPNVFEEWDENNKCILKTEMRKFSDWIINSFRNGNGMPIRFSEYDKAFNSILKINNAIKTKMHRPESMCGSCTKCGLGMNRFAAVNYVGDVFGCQELASPKAGVSDRFWIGNIFTGIDDERREELSKSFNPLRIVGDKCGSCRLNHICNGGCVANNYMYSGDLCLPSPVWCWWENLLVDEAIYIMQVLGHEQNQLFSEYWREVNGKQ